MKTFKDNQGRQWQVSVTVGSVKRVRGEVEVDLLKLGDGDKNLIGRLTGDPCLLVDVLYSLCRPQADALGVTADQFADAMAGDAVEAATMALLGDIADFFPSGRREVMNKLVGKVREIDNLIGVRAGAMVDGIDPSAVAATATAEAEAKMAQALTSGSGSTRPPASPASTPPPSPSAS